MNKQSYLPRDPAKTLNFSVGSSFLDCTSTFSDFMYKSGGLERLAMENANVSTPSHKLLRGQ